MHRAAITRHQPRVLCASFKIGGRWKHEVAIRPSLTTSSLSAESVTGVKKIWKKIVWLRETLRVTPMCRGSSPAAYKEWRLSLRQFSILLINQIPKSIMVSSRQSFYHVRRLNWLPFLNVTFNRIIPTALRNFFCLNMSLYFFVLILMRRRKLKTSNCEVKCQGDSMKNRKTQK